ncbi:MAG: hypothetical protein VX000_10780, partial [Myxococcota bacterium]|nr:hypothetical protein [Myxococcota bacterium]
MLCLLLGAALAADPWGRPAHLRAVAAPPTSWEARGSAHRAVRLFWDVREGDATVAAWTGRRWRVLSDHAQSGFQTPPLPDGTPLRVRLPGSSRWSPVVRAPPLVSPAGLAALAAVAPAVLGDTVGEVSPASDGSGAWIATFGGGAAWLDARLHPLSLTTWEGLPDDRVVSVHGDGRRTLVGTVAGAALLEGGRVTRIYDDELPDRHVQAVRVDGARLWLGTYRGLSRVESGSLTTILAPGSVFSLTPATGGGLWVGYAGVRRVDIDARGVTGTDEPTDAGWLRQDRVFAVLDTGRGVLAAGREAGLRLLHPDGTDRGVPGMPTTGAFDV